MKHPFKAETRRGVYREVFRRRDWLLKRYHYQGIRFDKPWLREHAALARLPQGQPQELLARTWGGRHHIVHRRRFIEGEVMDFVEPAELAQSLHQAHQRGVVGLDPHPANFVRDVEGTLRLIDFGRAVCAPAGSLRSRLAIGHEIHRVQIDAYRNPDDFRTFLKAYRPLVSEGTWRVVWMTYCVRRLARRLAGRKKPHEA